MCLIKSHTMVGKISPAENFSVKSEGVQSLYKINSQAIFFTGIGLHDYDINNIDSSDTDTSLRRKKTNFLSH